MSLFKGNKKIAGLYVDHEIEHATEAHAGIIEIADNTEVEQGVIDSKVVTPKKLKTALGKKQDTISDLATIRSNAKSGADLAPQVEVNTQRIEDLTVSKFPNATPIGQPTVQDSYVSGFSASTYMQFPFTDISRGLPFDIYFSFTTDDDVTTQQNILDSYFGIALAIMNGKGIMSLSSNGTSWDIGTSTGTNTLLPRTTYYAKYSWTGTEYTTALSLDNQTYTPDMKLTSNKSPYKTTIYIGGSPNLFGAGSAHPFKGTINFKGARVYLPTLDLDVWQGMADVGLASRANVSLNNLDEVGELRFANKQDVISDLATIRDGASKGATALQEVPQASTTVLGGIKAGNWLKVNADSAKLECGELTKAQYSSALGHTFISKTTLENVLTSDVVHKNGNETISGIKTFSNTPILTSGYLNLDNTENVSIQKRGINFVRQNATGSTVISGGDTDKKIFLRPQGDVNPNNQVTIGTDGTVTANKFNGELDGIATKATQDSDGNVIATTYLRTFDIDLIEGAGQWF